MKKIQILILLSLLYIINYAQSLDCSSNFESSVKSSCTNIYINSTHSCQYSNGQCNFNYKLCSSYKGNDETICKSIILSSEYNKCIMKGTTCTQVNKECDDYEEGLICSSLSAGTNKRCRLIDNECKIHYDKCEDFKTDVDETKCEANIPSNSIHKCVWTEGQCKEVNKKCKEVTASTSYCNQLPTSDDTNKICISSNYGCDEQYKTCALYNEKESSKTKNGCESINIYDDLTQSFDDTKLCSFEGTTCSVRDKQCSDFSYSGSTCKSFTPKDTNKICVYSNYQCKEQYKTCALYNEKESSKTKDGCESIKIYNDEKNIFDDTKLCTFSG